MTEEKKLYMREYMREYRKTEKRKLWEASYRVSEKRKICNDRFNKTEKGLNNLKNCNHQYLSTEKGLAARKRTMDKYRIENPEKVKARRITNYLISTGELIKEPCSVCGSTENIQCHHPDYSKPLDVVFLCQTHHYELHGVLNAIGV